MVIKTGKATVAASAPGVVASLDVAVLGMTASDNVVLTLAERDSAGDTRGQPDFYAVPGTDKFTITCEDKELQAATDVFWMAESGTTPQTLTGAGAVDLVSDVTLVDTTGGAAALTLADGVEGQVKNVVMSVDVGDGTLTPDNLGNGTTITFDDVGDSATLLFTNSAWHFMGGTATLA